MGWHHPVHFSPHSCPMYHLKRRVRGAPTPNPKAQVIIPSKSPKLFSMRDTMGAAPWDCTNPYDRSQLHGSSFVKQVTQKVKQATQKMKMTRMLTKSGLTSVAAQAN